MNKRITNFLAVVALLLTGLTNGIHAQNDATNEGKKYYLKLDYADADLYVNIPESGKVTVESTPCALSFYTFNGNTYISRADGNYWLTYGTVNAWDMYCGTDLGATMTAKITYNLANTSLSAVNPNIEGGPIRYFAVNSNAAGQQVYGDKSNVQSHWKLIDASTENEVIDVSDIAMTSIERKDDNPFYCPTNQTSYATWADAMTAVSSLPAATLCVYESFGLPNRVTVDGSQTLKALNIVPMADGIEITRGGKLTRTSMWFLTKSNNSATLNIGSDDHQLIIKGGGFGSSRDIRNTVVKREHGTITLNNVKFKDFEFGVENSNYGYIYNDNNAGNNLVMKNVVVENSRTINKAFFVTNKTSNDAIYLQGSLNIDSNSGTETDLNASSLSGRSDICCKARIRLGWHIDGKNTAIFTASNKVYVNWDGAATLGTVVVAKGSKSLDSFALTNSILDLGANNNDLYLTQAYTLGVSKLGAATLVLPFESTIPDGTSCYTLAYAGGDQAAATLVSNTLPADTPVLVNANEGSYRFVTTATEGTAITAGSGPVTEGALTGVYAATSAPVNSYVLQNKTNGFGFYKVAENSQPTVSPFRAYLSANTDAEVRLLRIIYDDETTGIRSIKEEKMGVEGAIYTLSGQRVSRPQKGIYIINGKKVVLK